MNNRRILGLVLIAVALVGCGTGSKTSSAGTSANAGTPGDPAKAARTIEVHINGGKRYDPSSISVTAGETVTFRVINDDSTPHQFVIGNDKTQNDYEKTMQSMGSTPMQMADTANSVDLEPGQSKSLTWAFPSTKGTKVTYASHQPGDYPAGMKGIILVG